ncbi:MAG: hypothetical protein AB7E79_05080 [Rhodospirillaceae bacterium]
MTDGIQVNDAAFVGSWLAEIRGSHVGNGYMEVSSIGSDLKAQLHVNIAGEIGIAEGAFSADRKTITFSEKNPQARATPVLADATIESSPPGSWWVKWKANTGAAGTVMFHPAQPSFAGGGNAARASSPAAAAPASPPTPVIPPSGTPPQLIIREHDLQAVTLSNAQIRNLLARMSQAIPHSFGTILTASFAGRTVRRYEAHWLASDDLPAQIDNLFIQRTENTTAIQKSISVQISQRNGNRVTVQSDDETWTAGAALAFRDFFQPHTSRIARYVKIAALVAFLCVAFATSMYTPDFDKPQRAVFLVVAMGLMVLLLAARDRAGQTRVFLVDRQPGLLEKHGPETAVAVVSGLITAALISVLSYVGSDEFAQWLQSVSH